MNKILLVVLSAVVLAATAGPATADVVYTPVDPAAYDFGIGLYNPNDPTTLNTVYVTSNNNVLTSDLFQFTFAAHMNAIYYNAESLHFNFFYDNSSIEVVHARPVAPPGAQPWLFNNYESMQWPNPSDGMVNVESLTQGFDPGGTSHMPMDTTAIVPFFQVTLHVKRAQESWVNVFGINQMTLVSHTWALSLHPGDFEYYNGAIHETPEPGSMALLACGLAALLGGTFVRRRRTA